jgi:hypothetical protein
LEKRIGVRFCALTRALTNAEKENQVQGRPPIFILFGFYGTLLCLPLLLFSENWGVKRYGLCKRENTYTLCVNKVLSLFQRSFSLQAITHIMCLAFFEKPHVFIIYLLGNLLK